MFSVNVAASTLKQLGEEILCLDTTLINYDKFVKVLVFNRFKNVSERQKTYNQQVVFDSSFVVLTDDEVPEKHISCVRFFFLFIKYLLVSLLC